MQEDLRKKIESIIAIVEETTTFPVDAIEELVLTVIESFKKGFRIAFVGNGGSAAEALHLAAEFVGKCVIDHPPLPAICLNSNQSAITAIANDYGSEFVFERIVEAHLKAGDVLVALSTSGTSRNVVLAIEKAVELGVATYLWTGAAAPDYHGVRVWRAPSLSTPRIQEIHLMWGHILAELVESKFKV